VYHNTGSDIRSLASDGQSLVFDRLGEIFTLDPANAAAGPRKVAIWADADLPDVRARLLDVGGQVQRVAISPSGVRVVVEAHGEVLTVPVKNGPIRNITNTPGVAEREPAWSPDGRSIAYFSDASGLYALHIAPQLGAADKAHEAVKVFPLAAEAAYYFDPVWSPDSHKITFHDNRLNRYVLDVQTGKLTRVGEQQVYGGFSSADYGATWSPDSKWLVVTTSLPNRMHGLSLYSLEQGTLTPLTDGMADATSPTFDRGGDVLYFLASNNAGAALPGIDMTTDLYAPTQAVYALTLSDKTPSPAGPQSDDEKPAGEGAASDETGDEGAKAKDKAKDKPAAKPVVIDLPGLDMATITRRTVALPLPVRAYAGIAAGTAGTLFVLEDDHAIARLDGAPSGTLRRYTAKDRKAEKVADHIGDVQVSADGKSLLVLERGEPGPTTEGKAGWKVIPAKDPAKPGEGTVSFAGLQVRVDPRAEWRQMYHEIWRIQRAYFYDPGFHGVNTVAEERRLAPYVERVQARVDLNYLFQEMLTGFSVGHLRGSGGAIPSAHKVPGGLLGADYTVTGGHYCLTRLYSGGSWTPDVKGPLTQPGIDAKPGDCVLAVNGSAVGADQDVQAALEGTAGKAITLTLGAADGKAARDVTVVPLFSENRLRNLDWIDGNRRKVAELSGGKLAYVYLPDTAGGGFTAFNRYFFAQTDKQGVVVDERFNAGGQIADYVIEVLSRRPQNYWSPRYGAIDRTPGAAIFGPKVMIANEVSGSGGDAMPWLFKANHLGPLVGKRTWGGLVGIGGIPVLMDGAQVTSPSVAFFNPAGQWEVENHGVDPDVVVDQDPALVAQGHDPQLEAAVKVAMQAMDAATPKVPPRPAYPDYHKGDAK
jgi:tricorn protease